MARLNYRSIGLEELLTLYRQADPEAFKEFFRRTRTFVFSFLRMKLGSIPEAEDVMQDTYFRVHRYVGSYDKSRNALAWLMSVTRNALYDYLRTHRGFATSSSFEENYQASPGPDPERLTELRQLVGQICGELSPEDRALLFERLINDTSYEEIAAAKGMRVENARQRLSRLLKRIRSAS